ncbi:MAG: hypothetical protein CBB87_08070 [Micavibrio sp. TMED27]|nr:hypothetical protein [Micavibrio sp.]OUT90627.1 MAG: hypothetical protein CBB87_08070 [Micavibrio sp. TMED27]|tara:strand:- start:2293 stop:3186 length:894 start_codon:yes stop_codon:yes gene_type:complete
MIINSKTLSAIKKNFISLFDKRFSAADPQWKKVAMKTTSSTASNVYAWLGATTRMREWLGERVIQNLKTHDFTIKNKPFEDTFGVDRDDVEDDNLGTYTPAVELLADDAANFPDELVFGLLKNADSTICYDGQNLVDTDHPVLDENGKEVSVSNSGGGAGNFWCVIDGSKPVMPVIFQMRKEFKFVALDNENDPNVFMNKQFIYGTDGRMNVGAGLWQLIQGSRQELTAANFSERCTAMEKLKGDNGRSLRLKPTLLVVGPSNKEAAKEILEKERNANGETNIHRGAVELLVVPEFG